MHLVQILLPLGNDAHLYEHVSRDLTEKFGGVTAYARAPADGRWKEDASKVVRDDIVVYEVMVEELDRAWWRDYRRRLEELFLQQELVIRTHAIERL